MDVRDNFNDNMTTYVAFFAGAALKRVAPAQPVVKLTNTI